MHTITNINTGFFFFCQQLKRMKRRRCCSSLMHFSTTWCATRHRCLLWLSEVTQRSEKRYEGPYLHSRKQTHKISVITYMTPSLQVTKCIWHDTSLQEAMYMICFVPIQIISSELHILVNCSLNSMVETHLMSVNGYGYIGVSGDLRLVG